MSKTLGEIARDAYDDPFNSSHHKAMDIAAAAVEKAVRSNVIEEAIEAVRQRSYRGDRIFNTSKVELLIKAIEDLKDKADDR